jgi:hypothetical protein
MTSGAKADHCGLAINVHSYLSSQHFISQRSNADAPAQEWGSAILACTRGVAQGLESNFIPGHDAEEYGQILGDRLN